MSSPLKKISFTLIGLITLILANYLSGIFAVFQYNLKPWSEGVDITPYQFSHYLKALMTGQIEAEHQATVLLKSRHENKRLGLKNRHVDK